ncbi:MAG: type II toxin-antitoxin system RelE/ParE family toxin [Bacteroidetes bacterium]|nr:type II toxin-antitoxin system RelE/ParE family toxin [Bacteroidota bacterium]
MLKIIWSDNAKSDYDENILFLLNKWGLKEAKEFVDEVDFVLDNLPHMAEMFPLSDYKEIRKGLICKQISLLYRVQSDRIELLRFWNNYQNPEKLRTIK